MFSTIFTVLVIVYVAIGSFVAGNTVISYMTWQGPPWKFPKVWEILLVGAIWPLQAYDAFRQKLKNRRGS
jgi:tryptophan-rich sensory protein